jgi:hypothetical protein
MQECLSELLAMFLDKAQAFDFHCYGVALEETAVRQAQ